MFLTFWKSTARLFPKQLALWAAPDSVALDKFVAINAVIRHSGVVTAVLDGEVEGRMLNQVLYNWLASSLARKRC